MIKQKKRKSKIMAQVTFDTEFKRLTTEMVEVAFEYIGFNRYHYTV